MDLRIKAVNGNNVLYVENTNEEFSLFDGKLYKSIYNARFAKLISKRLLLLTIIVPLTGCSISNNVEAIPDDDVIYVSINQDNMISQVPLEEYLVGVVAAEMPASFGEEPLKAQAVAARTYALNKIAQGYILETTTFHQAYITEDEMRTLWGKDYDKYYNLVKKAVDSTIGEVLTYNNKLIDALYHSSNPGRTSNSEDYYTNNIPYLRSVESKYDYLMDNNHTYKYSLDEFKKALNIEDLTLNIGTNTIDNTVVLDVNLNGTTVSGTYLRSKLGLRSAYFSITVYNDEVIVNTKGYGHGVGMSQYGAYGMGMNGYNYSEILHHYYTDVELVNYNNDITYSK